MHDFKITFLTERKTEDQLYAERMAKTIYRFKIDRPKSDAQKRYEDRDEYPATYQAYLDRRFPPDNWKAVPDAKTTDEAVGYKHFDSKQLLIAESLRKQSKNIQGDFMADALTSAETRREAAENAFMVSPGITTIELTDEQRVLLIALSGYSDPPLPIDEPKQSLLQRFKRAFRLESKDEVDKNNLAYVLYKISGGKDEDL